MKRENTNKQTNSVKRCFSEGKLLRLKAAEDLACVPFAISPAALPILKRLSMELSHVLEAFNSGDGKVKAHNSQLHDIIVFYFEK